MFGLEMTPTTTFWLVFGMAFTPLFVVLMFKGAVALADVNDPSWSVSFLIAVVYSAVFWLAAVGCFTWLQPQLDGVQLYVVIILSFLASGIACWIVCSGVYALVLYISLKKSIYMSSAQLMLETLIGTLAIGITLFVLSVMQIKQPPANKTSGMAPDSASSVVVLRHTAP